MMICKVCSVDNCNSKHHGLGYCVKHYTQYRNHGKILQRTRFEPNNIWIFEDYAQISLYDRNGNYVNYTKIDLEDVNRCKKYKWGLRGTGYVRTTKVGDLHNFILNRDTSDHMIVCDHINRDKLDNRKCNLRIVNQTINNYNTGLRKNNTTGVIGVDFVYNKWRARISNYGMQINLGMFNNKTDAVQARKSAEIKYYGELS